jgi:hypothetical protein
MILFALGLAHAVNVLIRTDAKIAIQTTDLNVCHATLKIEK